MKSDFGQQRVEIDPLGLSSRSACCVGMHVVIQDMRISQPPMATLGHGEPDAAHADDAERAAGQVLADMPERLPGLPLAVGGVAAATRRSAGPPRSTAQRPCRPWRRSARRACCRRQMPRSVAAGMSMLLKPTA